MKALERSAAIAAGAILVLAGLAACSDSTDTTDGTSSSSSSSSSSGGNTSSSGSGAGGSTSGAGGSTSGAGGSAQGGGGGAQGGGGGGGEDLQQAAETFCTSFDATCGFGGSFYADQDDCIDDYVDKYDQGRRDCVETHLGLAANDPGTHCPHAAGEAPCS